MKQKILTQKFWSLVTCLAMQNQRHKNIFLICFQHNVGHSQSRRCDGYLKEVKSSVIVLQCSIYHPSVIVVQKKVFGVKLSTLEQMMITDFFCSHPVTLKPLQMVITCNNMRLTAYFKTVLHAIGDNFLFVYGTSGWQ